MPKKPHAGKSANDPTSSPARFRQLFQGSPSVLWELDLTEIQKEFEAILASGESLERRFARHPEQVPALLAKAKIVDVNHAAVVLAAARDKQELFQRFTSLFLPESEDFFKHCLLEMQQGRTTIEGEIPFLTLDGVRHKDEVRVSLLSPEKKIWKSVLIYIHDISERKRAEDALQQDLSRYARLFNNTHAPLLELDLNSAKRLLAELCAQGISDLPAHVDAHPEIIRQYLDRIVPISVNTPALLLFKAPDRDYLLSHWTALFRTPSSSKLKQTFLSLAQGDVHFECELSLQTFDQTPLTVIIQISRALDPDDAQQTSLVSFQDITARKRMEDDLRESEEKLRSVIDNIGIGVAVISPGMEILRLNRQMQDWNPSVNVGAKPICYRAFNQPPRENPCTYCPTLKTLADGLVHEAITETPMGDKVVNFRVVASPIKNAQGQVTAAIEMVEDVTSRRVAEEKLRESEARLRTITDSAQDGIIMINSRGQITFWNPAAWNILGFSPEEALGQSLHDLIAPQQYMAAFRKAFAGFTQTGQGKAIDRNLEVEARRKDGQIIAISLSLAAVKLSDGWNAVGVMRDMTEHRKLESDLQQAQKLEAVGQLAAGIAHEINTPAQYVGDNLRFLQESLVEVAAVKQQCLALVEAAHRREITPELLAGVDSVLATADLAYLEVEIPRAIQQSLDGVDRVTTIVRALKNFVHPDSADKVMVNLNETIASTITVARSEWRHVANLTTEFDADLPLVPCFVGEFNQVILNLIVNAAQAIGDLGENGGKGQITVSTRSDGAAAEIRVADTGPGIAADVLPRIFDPFFTTKKVGRGTGQGLTIARTVIVKKHGGTIDVKTAMGQGTTFIIRLPFSAGVPETIHSPS